jgi:hypothetical protein
MESVSERFIMILINLASKAKLLKLDPSSNKLPPPEDVTIIFDMDAMSFF